MIRIVDNRPKSRWSASLAKVEAEGADMGRKPQRLHASLLISRFIRSRSPAEVKPNQEGEAYIKDATVVPLATSCNLEVGRQYVLVSMMKANAQSLKYRNR